MYLHAVPSFVSPLTHLAGALARMGSTIPDHALCCCYPSSDQHQSNYTTARSSCSHLCPATASHLPLPLPLLSRSRTGLGTPSAARSLLSISASRAARSSGVSKRPGGGPASHPGGGPPLPLRPSRSNTERGPGGGNMAGPRPRGGGGLGQSRAMWPSWPHLKQAPGPPPAPGAPGLPGGPLGSHLRG
jgi:hypothetical protein